ncbi:MAG TPA: hypothetical protein DCX06_07825 [Opitutae bacterium]|nr:hypothetical protein [Opitutae bacterium]
MNILSESIFFPLQNKNLKMFFCLVGLFILQHFINYAPIISLASYALIGYIYATHLKIIFTTGNGYKDAPDFPDFGDIFDNIAIPLLKVAGVWIAGMLPAILIIWQTDVSETAAISLMLTAFLYIPLGLMIAAMDDYSKAFNPVVLIQAIRSAGSSYVIMIVAFMAFSLLSFFLDGAFPASWILEGLIGAYGILFTGRLIGFVFRERISGHDEG